MKLTFTVRSNGLLCPLIAVFTISLGMAGPDTLARHIEQQRTPASSKSQSNSEGGRAIFESTCAACHGLDGRGGERGPDIATRQQVAQLSDAQTLAVLRNGKIASGMPGFGSLGAPKLKELLAYLRTLQGKGQTTSLPGDAAKGKALFFGKARCSECHMVRGEGGFLGRELTSYGAVHAPEQLRSQIAGPMGNIGRANRMFAITLRDSQKITGVIRNEDNFSIQLLSPDGAFHFVSRADIAELKMLPDPVMPTDYGKTLTPAELDDLVSFLAKEAGGTVTVKKEFEAEE